MTCVTIEPDLVDLARGVVPSADRGAAIDRHLRECPRCPERFENERAMSAALRRLAEKTDAPPVDPERERKTLAAFDAAWDRRSTRHRSRPVAAAAALLALAATLAWMIVNRPAAVPTATPPPKQDVAHASRPANIEATNAKLKPGAPASTPGPAALVPAARPVRPHRLRRARPLSASPTATEFVVWPGAADLPRFESGHLMRMALPASMVVSLGLRPAPDTTVVQADVLVGQDGYARAVRLVP